MSGPAALLKRAAAGLGTRRSAVPFFLQPFHWYRLAGPHRLFWLAGPLLFYSWTLTGPLLSDDLNLLLRAEKYQRGESSRLGLMRFAATDDQWQDMRSRGSIPWWAPDRGRLDFFRPVTEWSFYLDVVLFGRNPLGYRAVSLAIFAIALLCAHGLYRAAGADATRAGLATFLLGISQALTAPVTWMANRQDLLVLIGVALAATAYWNARSSRAARGIALAVAAFAFALLSKEIAIALAGVVLVHEIVRQKWSIRGFVRSRGGQMAAALTLTAVVYLAYYAYSRPWAFGLGGASDGAPNQLNARLPLSLLTYTAVWTLGFPIDILLNAGALPTALFYAVAGYMLILTVHYLRKSTRGDAAALFFILWAILFIVPGLRSLTAGTRTLCNATLGWTYLVAGLMVPAAEAKAVVPLFTRHVFNAANGLVSVVAAVVTVLYMNSTELRARERLEAIVARQTRPLADGDTLFIEEAFSPLEIMCAGDRLEFLTGQKNVGAIFLLPPGASAELAPDGPTTLVARSRDGSLMNAPMHGLTLGRNWRPQPGRTYDLRDLAVRIAQVDAHERVTELRVDFRKPMAAGAVFFDPPSLAAAVGQAATLRTTPP